MVKDIFGNEITHDVYGNPLKKDNKRKTVYSYDKDKVLQKQKGLCAGKDCKRLHNGKRMPVNIRSNFDHIISLKLGGRDNISNLQALCANCHQLKTREDRKLIAQKKQRKNNNSGKSNYYINPLTGKKEKTNNLWEF